MNLYQIFYRAAAFDADAPLPSQPLADTLYAVQTTGELKYLVPGNGCGVAKSTHSREDDHTSCRAQEK